MIGIHRLFRAHIQIVYSVVEYKGRPAILLCPSAFAVFIASEAIFAGTSQLAVVFLLLHKANLHTSPIHLALASIPNHIASMASAKRTSASKNKAAANRRSGRVRKPSQRARQPRASSSPSPSPSTTMDDSPVVPETPPSSQDVARLRAELQREEATHRVEVDAAAEANRLRAEIKRLQAKRGISIVQQHAMEEEPFGGRRSFLHHGNEPQFMPLARMFPAVNRKHFAEIFRCTFMPEQLHKLVNDYSARNALGIEAENGLSGSDIKGMSHLTRCFEVYCQVVLELAPESMYRELNKAFCLYRCHLNTLLASYTFESVLAFHKTFMYARISEVQDDPEG